MILFFFLDSVSAAMLEKECLQNEFELHQLQLIMGAAYPSVVQVVTAKQFGSESDFNLI